MAKKPETYEQVAERIIKTEGFMFALAVAAGKGGELCEARVFLKNAIVKALADEAQRHRQPSAW